MAVRSRASSVIVHRVAPPDRDAFLGWQAAVAEAASKFSGYQDTDLYPPEESKGIGPWVVVMHFDDDLALSKWCQSEERAKQIAAYSKVAESNDFEIKNIPGGFGHYFTQPKTPPWKMMFTILLALYPTVLLLTRFVGPYTSPLGFAVSMLIGNALSTVLLDRVVMPLTTRLLEPWLVTKKPSVTLGGLLAVLAALAALTAGFRALWG